MRSHVIPKLPEGELLYAVGDIHGRTDLLAALLRQIEADAAGRTAAKKNFSSFSATTWIAGRTAAA